MTTSPPTIEENPSASSHIIQKALSADSLLENEFPEPDWLISNLLPVGLTIFAGAPKIGKSWFALQIAKHVASGETLFGEEVKQGNVLYCALEDPAWRLQVRLNKQDWGKGLPVYFEEYKSFLDEVGNILYDGYHILDNTIQEKKLSLVVIDTLSKATSDDQNDVREMTNWMTALHQLSVKNKCSVLVIDHHRKSSFDSNVVEDILGSTAKSGVADTVMGLYRKSAKSKLTLKMTGRDIETKKLKFSIDWDTGLYSLHGEEGGIQITQQRSKIMDAIGELEQPTANQLAEHLGIDKGNLHKQLSTLFGAGKIKKVELNGNEKGSDKYCYELP